MEPTAQILIVEDTEEWQGIFSESLLAQGYKVTQAREYQEAKAFVERRTFDVAIVDIRLSEGDNLNQEGMKLLEDIRKSGDQTGIIIVSGFATVGLTRDAFIKHEVSEFIEKDLFDESVFLETVQQIIRNSSPKAHGAKLSPRNILRESGLSQDVMVALSASQENLDDLLNETFAAILPFSKTLPVTSRLTTTSDGERIVQLVAWSKGIGEAVAVRIGPKEVLKGESQNFTKYIKDLTTQPVAKMGPYYKSGLGALVYELSGAKFDKPVVDFKSFYNNKDASFINSCITDVFDKICRGLYIDRGVDILPVSLANAYKLILAHAIAYQKKEFESEDSYLDQLEDDERQPYLEKRTVNKAVLAYIQEQSFIFESPVGIVHGDLCDDNIIAGEQGHVWLTGFHHTGISDVYLDGTEARDSLAFRAYQIGKRNLFHDFATLEVCIRRTLRNIDPDELVAFNSALCEAKDFGQSFSFQPTISNPQLSKAIDVLGRLRELSWEVVDNYQGDMRLYYSELLFQFLRYYATSSDITEKERMWASILALVERLKRW